MNQEIVSLVIRELGDLLPEDEDVELDAETSLYGEGGILDSFGLVSLVVAIEQAIEDEYSTTVTLADEKAMSLKNSPFRTIGTLAEYAEGLI